jgi:hypothetical protein
MQLERYCQTYCKSPSEKIVSSIPLFRDRATSLRGKVDAHVARPGMTRQMGKQYLKDQDMKYINVHSRVYTYCADDSLPVDLQESDLELSQMS